MIKNKKIVIMDLGSITKTLSGRAQPICIGDIQPNWKAWNALRQWAQEHSSEGYLFILPEKSKSTEGASKAQLNFLAEALKEYIEAPGISVDSVSCPYTKKERSGKKDILESVLKKYSLGSLTKADTVLIGKESGRKINSRCLTDDDYQMSLTLDVDYQDIASV